VDSRGAHGSDYGLGMGSSVTFDKQGTPHISYYSDTEIRHAWQEAGRWKVEAIEKITPTGGFADYRSSIVFDRQGVLHISYEDSGVLKHAFRDGNQWQVQVVAPRGRTQSRYSSMTVDTAHDLLYIAYADPLDGSVRVAIGRKTEAAKLTDSH